MQLGLPPDRPDVNKTVLPSTWNHFTDCCCLQHCSDALEVELEAAHEGINPPSHAVAHEADSPGDGLFSGTVKKKLHRLREPMQIKLCGVGF